MKPQLFVIGLALLGVHVAALGGEDEEYYEEAMIHSDLPLFVERKKEDMWPRGFPPSDPDQLGIDCLSKIPPGKWRMDFDDRWNEHPTAGYWIEFGLTQGFHCFGVVARARRERELENAETQPVSFVPIGSTKMEGRETELWVMQVGGRPGSQYTLLARDTAQADWAAFSVLQSECPRRFVRDAGPIDIMRTDYCAINSQQDLLRLAKSMAKKPPLGTLKLVQDEKGPEADASDPSEISD